MKIGLPSHSPLLSLSEVKPALNNWKVGQTLQAIVIEPGRTNKQQVILKIGTQQVHAKNVQTPFPPLSEGVNLKLKIMSLSPVPVLKVLSENKIELKNEIIRNFLPRQTAYPSLLASLHALSESKTRLQEKIPVPLQVIINKLIDQLPTPSSVSSPQGLKSDLNNSGIFFEQKILQKQNTSDKPIDFTKDFKFNLLALANEIKQQIAKEGKTDSPPFVPQSLTPAGRQFSPINTVSQTFSSLVNSSGNSVPKELMEGKPLTVAISNSEKNTSLPPMHHTPVVAQAKVFDSLVNIPGINSLLSELFELVDGTLSRLRLTQLANTQVDTNVVYLFELPVKNQNGIDVINLKIEQENSNQKHKNQQGWNITLAFNFEELGPVYAHITLRGKKVNTNITSEYHTTKLLFEKHMDKLKESLSQAGMEINNLCCTHGKIEQRNLKTHISPILDTKA
ncbi:MAG: flagellar hook-length control protein FliK [Gammaproteobacteria bacterium]|nr:flagellar hook-length control protein FliK [Gammaproteobacteria bacterium]